MGEIPNYFNKNSRHLNPNPNPNPNQNPKSNKKKHFSDAASNGRPRNHNTHAVDSCAVPSQASDGAYSFNQRPIDTGGGYGNGFNHGGYVRYNVAACSRIEINELRKKLVSDLERIRNLNDRIQSGNINPKSSNGNFKKISGKKRLPSSLPFGSVNKDPKHLRQGLVNGNGGGEADENLFKMCKQVLTKLMKHKLSWVFKKPVDAVALGLHDYHQIIKQPMDLGTVKSNLSKNLYTSPLDFASDVQLVFENAMLYNPGTDKVHGMADQLLTYFEQLFRPIQSKLATSDHVNEFSAIDDLDRSSCDDIQTPEKPNNLIPPAVVQSPVRIPLPIQVSEPIKPSTRVAVAKLPKPRAKDLNKREMNMEEKQNLGLGLQSLPQEKMPQLLQIIRKRTDRLAQEGDEIELDIEALDTETLWELDRFVTNWKKHVSKTMRQALLVNSGPSVSADIDNVFMKKNRKDVGEEDVDIGDEMLEISFPHVEIEKDDGSGGSISSSSGDSSSSSDSGSDSDADDAQS